MIGAQQKWASQQPTRFRLLVGTGKVLDAMAELYPQHLPGDRALQRIEEEVEQEEQRKKMDKEGQHQEDKDGEGIGKEMGSGPSSRAIHVAKGGGGGSSGRVRAGSKEGSLDESGFGPRCLADNVISSSRRRVLRLAMLEVIYLAITATNSEAGHASSNGASASSSSSGGSGTDGGSGSGGGSALLLSSSSNGAWFSSSTPIEGEVKEQASVRCAYF